jgi:deferrochelatase/peroxidase EfeB
MITGAEWLQMSDWQAAVTLSREAVALLLAVAVAMHRAQLIPRWWQHDAAAQ